MTRTRIVEPASAATRSYVRWVAPAMLAHGGPAAVQRCHWYVKDVGLFVHEPFCAVKVSPTRGVPVMEGGAVFAGGAACADEAAMVATVKAAATMRIRLTSSVLSLDL
jgi:hypothetical protein